MEKQSKSLKFRPATILDVLRASEHKGTAIAVGALATAVGVTVIGGLAFRGRRRDGETNGDPELLVAELDGGLPSQSGDVQLNTPQSSTEQPPTEE